MPGDILLTVSGVELACGEKQPQVSIMAYSGAAMRVPGWGVIVLDLAGLDLAGRVPILCDHDASLDGILGQGAAEVKGVDMNEEDIRAQERERLAKITALCDGDWGHDKDRVDVLKARAISGEIEGDELSAKLPSIMRNARPAVGAIRTAITAPQPLAIEAALLMRLGHADLAEKTLGERACDAGGRLSGAHLLDLRMAAWEPCGPA